MTKKPTSGRVTPIHTLTDVSADPRNANRGTERGRAALEQSMLQYGAGRAILIDRHGRIIAGNKTAEQAKQLKMPLRVVKTDGTYLVAVQREDLDLATDQRAQALAILDGRFSMNRGRLASGSVKINSSKASASPPSTSTARRSRSMVRTSQPSSIASTRSANALANPSMPPRQGYQKCAVAPTC